MDTQTVILLSMLIIAVAIAAYQVATGKRTIRTWNDALETFDDAARLVHYYAPAADQLVKIKELKPEERRNYVLRMVFSHLKDIDTQQVIGIIEAWVAEQKNPKAAE
jgi:hypothetical protein